MQMAKIKAHIMKPGSKKEVGKAKFSATSKAVDPGLAALFASSVSIQNSLLTKVQPQIKEADAGYSYDLSNRSPRHFKKPFSKNLSHRQPTRSTMREKEGIPRLRTS